MKQLLHLHRQAVFILGFGEGVNQSRRGVKIDLIPFGTRT